MTASELQDLIIDFLARRGGTKRRWRIALGPIRIHDLATSVDCNWSAAPSGTAREIAEIERLLDEVRLSHPFVRAD